MCHETFWIAVSAAAPIIALAAVFAYNDLGRRTLDRAWDDRANSANVNDRANAARELPHVVGHDDAFSLSPARSNERRACRA